MNSYIDVAEVESAKQAIVPGNTKKAMKWTVGTLKNKGYVIYTSNHGDAGETAKPTIRVSLPI